MSFLDGIIYILWRGFAIGVIISAPMGPVGILCVQRTLEKGRKTGFYTGVGAAVSDLFYCLVTGFGLSLIEDFLKANQDAIQIAGSIVMAVFGLYLFRSNPSRQLKKPDSSASSAGKRDIIKGFLFTFSNPLIIFLIIGLFARFNFLLPEISFAQYVTGYLFIIVGALGWWWMVSYFVDKVRSHFNLRSMWLINKITGSIIMIFALVGVITAVANIAKAAAMPALYLNSGRGMGEWDNSRKSNFVAVPAGDFAFSLRMTGNGCRHCSWALVLKNDEHDISMMIDKNVDPYNELYPASLSVRAFQGENQLAAKSVVLDGGFDDPVALRLNVADSGIVLSGGDRSYGILAGFPGLGWMPDSVGVISEGDGKLIFDYISLEGKPGFPETMATPTFDFGDVDACDSYFARSSDPLEGYWEIYDRTLEDARLRMGGDYRFAIARAAEGYGLYYINGAVKNPDKWERGNLKGMLQPTSHKDVFNVKWVDPEGAMIDGEIKAGFSGSDLIVFQFVDHDSILRLRKVAPYINFQLSELHDGLEISDL